MRFEANQRQVDPPVNFISRGGGYTLFLAPAEAVMISKSRAPSPPWEGSGDAPQTTRSVSSVLRMKLVGGNPSAKVEGLEQLPGKTNYLIGSDPSKWRTSIPSYKKVGYRDIYPGIDLIYYGNRRQLEYDFVVAPGADPELITLGFEGCEKGRISEGGDLLIGVAGGEEISFHQPHIYQEVNGIRRVIGGGYRLIEIENPPNPTLEKRNSPNPTLKKGGEGGFKVRPEGILVGFKVSPYDRKTSLVIDPTLSYSTYLGGSDDDEGFGIAVDSSGFAYVTGKTSSTSFPIKGAYQNALAGAPDAFVTKLATDGASLVYSTYLGGTDSDIGYSIAVDSSGFAYVTGKTVSTDFPTLSAFQPARASTTDAFVTKLTTNGASLVYSTYLGGAGDDYGKCIAVGSSGFAYVKGSTTSTNFPTSSAAYQTSYGGGSFDAFVTKLATNGASLVYSTYLGGSGAEENVILANILDFGNCIAVDSSGFAYVTGATASTNFPTTSGAYQTSYGGGNNDAFVTKLATSGASLVYSTYLGGAGTTFAGNDLGYGIAVDSSGFAYVTGTTRSSTFPTTSGAYKTSKPSPTTKYSAFVTKLATAGGGLVYSTYLGGSDHDYGLSIAVDSNGNPYVTGNTVSTNFPTTSEAYQSSRASTSPDVFFTKLANNGASLVYSTYLGGSQGDYGCGIALDSSGNAYVAGYAGLAFPTTSEAYQTSYGNTTDAFVSKFSGLPTAVRLISFTATEYEGRVLLQWKTGYEVDNLGFHLYREENGQLIRLTPSLIAGSALLAAGTPLTAGHSYSWWDRLDLSPQTSALGPKSSELRTPNFQLKYLLEDIDLNGKRTWYGPIQIKPETRWGDREIGRWGENERSGDKSAIRIPHSAIQYGLEGGHSRLISQLGRDSETRTNRGKIVQASAQLPQITPTKLKKQWEIAAGPAVKLSIREEGWYRVSQPELIGAGLDPEINPRRLQLFVDGEEQPISVTGEKDKRFDPQDTIEFYGMGLDTPSTDRRVYWLVAGSRPGKRIQRVRGQGGKSGASSFPYTVERKDRTIYFSALRNGDADNFFGPIVATEPVEQILNLSHLAPPSSGEALLEISLQGLTQNPHRIKVWLNEMELGEVVFEGQSLVSSEFTLPQSWLLEGENLVSLEAQGGETDLGLIDSIRLTYWHSFTAEGESLRFTARGGKRVMADGFSSPQIRVMDITYPEAVREVAGVVNPSASRDDYRGLLRVDPERRSNTPPSKPGLGAVERVKQEAEGFAIEFRAPSQGNRTLLAFTEDQVKEPAEITANQASAWHGKNEGADMAIIAHRDFLGSLGPLKALREAQGYSVELIDAEDLYDEFSFGQKSPGAIQDFLKRARSYWMGPPRFVLLVGDASYDPRNYLGLGSYDFIPTKLVDTAYMETASDDWFVDFNGDGLPEMAIGRLPVRTPEEAAHVVSKIITYDQAAAGAWTKEVLLVADQGGDFDFEKASQEVGDLFPEEMTVWGVYRGQTDDETARSAILGSINEGKLLVNYMGHGGADLWRGSILVAGDAATLTNGSRLTFMVGMTCLNGFFQTPYVESLSEALLKAENGGAVAVWSSSGLTVPNGQAIMNQELIRLLFNGEQLTLGEATARAKAATTDGDIRRTWILFGDPTTRLRD